MKHEELCISRKQAYCQNGPLFWFYVTLWVFVVVILLQLLSGGMSMLWRWSIGSLRSPHTQCSAAISVCGLVFGHIYRAGVCCSVSEMYRCSMIDVLSVSSCWGTLSDPLLSCWSYTSLLKFRVDRRLTMNVSTPPPTHTHLLNKPGLPHTQS